MVPQLVLDFDLDIVTMGHDYFTNRVARQATSCDHTLLYRDMTHLLSVMGLSEFGNSGAPRTIDGLAFEDHSLSAIVWLELIERGILRIPFTVLHVDSHHDIYSDPDYSHGIVHPMVNCGNYLVPFLECGAIDQVIWITPGPRFTFDGLKFPRRLRHISVQRPDLRAALHKLIGNRSIEYMTAALSPDYCSTAADVFIPLVISRICPSDISLEIMRRIRRNKKLKHEFDRTSIYLAGLRRHTLTVKLNTKPLRAAKGASL